VAPKRANGPNRAKRAFDVALVVPLFVFSSPLAAFIALAIRLDSPGPVLFWQERVGKNGELFALVKFRTMRTGTPVLPTDQMASRLGQSAVTRVGRLLRRTSLDELPQIWNVLKGEMSLVGPRPALVMQVELNARRAQNGVDELLPGITGWAQINGRDSLSDEAKIACDHWYRDNRSLKLDLLILARTVLAVLSGRGNR
jgi:O-antigen biosynthesis protein WbqP